MGPTHCPILKIRMAIALEICGLGGLIQGEKCILSGLKIIFHIFGVGNLSSAKLQPQVADSAEDVWAGLVSAFLGTEQNGISRNDHVL